MAGIEPALTRSTNVVSRCLNANMAEAIILRMTHQSADVLVTITQPRRQRENLKDINFNLN